MEKLTLGPLGSLEARSRCPVRRASPTGSLLLAALATGTTAFGRSSIRTTRALCWRRFARWACDEASTAGATTSSKGLGHVHYPRRPSCLWATRARLSGRSPRPSRSRMATTSSPASRACTSARSAISSMVFVRSARDRLPRQRGISASHDRSGHGDGRAADRVFAAMSPASS